MEVVAIPYKTYKPVDRLKERTVILQEFRGKKIKTEDIGNAIMIIKGELNGQELV